MDWLARRWGERRASRLDRYSGGGEDRRVTVGAERVTHVDASLDSVWRVVGPPAGLVLGAGDGAYAFELPHDGGSPGGTQWCLVGDTVYDALLGRLVEVNELEPHVRFVAQGLSWPHRPRWEVTLVDAHEGVDVRLAVTAAVHPWQRSTWRQWLATLCEFQADALRAALAGQPPPVVGDRWSMIAAGAPTEPAHHAAHQVSAVTATAEADLDLTPDEAWDLVLDPARSLWGEARGRGARVPGTPVGAVGERLAMVSEWDGLPHVLFVETVEIGPGRRIVRRHLSTSHPAIWTTTVTARDGGSRVVTELVNHVRPLRAAEAQRDWGTTMREYVAGLGAAGRTEGGGGATPTPGPSGAG